MLLPSLYFFLLPLYFTISVVHMIAICCKIDAVKNAIDHKLSLLPLGNIIDDQNALI